MTRSGVRPKGSKILDTICHDRIPKKERHVITAVLEKNLEGKTEAQKKKIRNMAKARAARSAKCAEIRAKKEADPNWKEEVEEKEEEETGELLTKKEQQFEKMLMRVFEKSCGEKKLIEMTKKSDALKMTIVKLLMDMEKKKFEMRMRAKIPQGSNAPGFFFVIKNFGDEQKASEAASSMKFLEQVIQPRDEIIDLEKDGEGENNEP